MRRRFERRGYSSREGGRERGRGGGKAGERASTFTEGGGTDGGVKNEEDLTLLGCAAHHRLRGEVGEAGEEGREGGREGRGGGEGKRRW